MHVVGVPAWHAHPAGTPPEDIDVEVHVLWLQGLPAGSKSSKEGYRDRLSEARAAVKALKKYLDTRT